MNENKPYKISLEYSIKGIPCEISLKVGEKRFLPKISKDLGESVLGEIKGTKDYITNLLDRLRYNPVVRSTIHTYFNDSSNGHELALSPSLVYLMVNRSGKDYIVTKEAVDQLVEEISQSETLEKFYDNIVDKLRKQNPIVLEIIIKATKRFHESIICVQAGLTMYRLLEAQSELNHKRSNSEKRFR